MDQMLVAEKFNADKSEDSQLLEIGSSKPKVKMAKKMMHQTTRSSLQEPHNSQSALA